MGWGIRGQFGHESGAMIPGVLIALTIAVMMLPSASGLRVARFAALAAVGFSFGGSMTYGQTLGLSQNVEIREVGYWWGMLGTTVKGSIWVGLAGAFMGIALSRQRYTVLWAVRILLGMILLWLIGVHMLNGPLDPANMKLPSIYFSDYWNAGQAGWKPRQELWGGLAFALAGLLIHLALSRRDGRAVALALFGLVAGGVGFTLGQSLQAYCAWHSPFSPDLARYIDAWKIMEVTFGLVVGLVMAFACLVLYSRQDLSHYEDEVTLSPITEIILFLIMADVMLLWNVRSYASIDVIADIALTMGIIPIACIVGGRVWPYLGATLYIVVPIAGRAVQAVVYDQEMFGEAWGLTLLFRLPLLVMLLVGLLAMRRGERSATGASSARLMTIAAIWVFTLLSGAQSVIHRRLFSPTQEQWDAAGGVFAHIGRSLGSALTVEGTFLAFAVILTVVLWRARRCEGAVGQA